MARSANTVAAYHDSVGDAYSSIIAPNADTSLAKQFSVTDGSKRPLTRALVHLDAAPLVERQRETFGMVTQRQGKELAQTWFALASVHDGKCSC